MENVITFGKLIGVLILFCPLLLSILCLKTPKIMDVMGTIFLVYKWLQSALKKLDFVHKN